MLQLGLISASACVLLAQAPASVPVTGHVFGPNGKPIKGAVVALVPCDLANGLSPLLERRTGSQGQFNLAASAGCYGLTITAPGCLPHFQNLTVQAGSPQPPLDLHLKRGGFRIQGRVLPAPGHTLEAVRLGFSKTSNDRGDQFYGTVNRGSFEVTLAEGSYLAQATAKGQTGSLRLKVDGNQPRASLQLRALPTPADPATLAWIRHHAHPLKGVTAGEGFADMQPLKNLVGDATIVALGEATHGTREFFQLKHRMLEFLVNEMGFTVFAIEANLPEAFAVNEYVLEGKGDPAKALAGLYFWTWNTEEVLDMIRWMRAYNADPSHTSKLKFYGVDMQTPTVAYAQAKAWMDRQAPAEAARLQEIEQSLANQHRPNQPDRSAVGLKAWATAAEAMDQLTARLEARQLPGEEAERQIQNLRILAQFDRMEADPDGGYAIRDASMAANLQWVQSREKGAKVVLWAHNGHITYRPGSVGGINSMGWHLRKALGTAYRPIGFAFQEGGFQAIGGDSASRGLKVFEVKAEPAGTLDAALAATGFPVLALDLRTRPTRGPVKQWLESPQGTWGIGALFAPEHTTRFIQEQPITESYDGLLFVKHTTSARPVGGRAQVPVRAPQEKAARNLGFEEGLSGWSNPKDLGYTATVADQGAKEGNRCLQVTYQGEPKPNAWWTTMQAVDATPYRGHRVRLKAWIRTDTKPDFKAMCWVRVDRKDGAGFFDNMMQRPVTGADWTEITIEGPVAEDAVALNFGCMAMGAGTAWFDGLSIERMP